MAMSRLQGLAVGIALLPALLATSQAAQAACVADWSKAGTIVREQGLTPAGDLADLARPHVGGDLVKIQLCEQDGRYVYRLTFFQDDGSVVKMTVDANEPFPG